jgi:xanthine dehydrogenase accessory factor
VTRRHEVYDALAAWLGEGTPVAVATLVTASGSAPRPIGSRLVVSGDGRMVGSVSGGCVEGAVIELALEALSSGEGRLVHYGISDETSWSVGLTCGGEIDVFVEPLDEGRRAIFGRLAQAVADERPVGTAAIVAGAAPLGTHLLVDTAGEQGRWPAANGDAIVARLRNDLEADPGPAVLATTPDGDGVFTNVVAPPPTAWIVGGDNVAIYLVRFLADAGFHPVVVDPREAFADPYRFPGADVRLGWPDEVLGSIELGRRDYVIVISNDPKIDEPALLTALAGQPAYVGAIGSRHKQEERRDALLSAGVTEERIAQLHAPIGLDLAGSEPAELALSIAAELVAVRRGGTGHPMREVRPIMAASPPSGS